MTSFDAELYARMRSVPKPILSVLRKEEFTNAKFLSMDIYDPSEMILGDNDLRAYGRTLIRSAGEGFNHAKIGKLILLLAMNLRKDSKSLDRILKGKYTSAVHTINRSEIEVDEAVPANPAEAEAREAETANARMLALAENRVYVEPQRNDTQVRFNGCDPSFYAFFAAFLLKIIIKTPENVSMSIEHMRRRYLGFYKESTEEQVRVTVQGLSDLQQKLKADQLITNTWIHAIATTEEELKPQEDAAGILRYVATLQFSFNGMQSYGLFREVMLFAGGVPADWIVRFWLESTQSTLLSIKRILEEQESYENEQGGIVERKPYFKYARVINPQYFLELQSSSCVNLIYLECKVLAHFAPTSNLSDPRKIAVLAKIGEDHREFLDCMASAILKDASVARGQQTSVARDAAEAHRLRMEAKAKQVSTTEAAMAALLGGSDPLVNLL